MSKRNNNYGDERLLIAGLFLLFTGAGTGLGIFLLAIYAIKKVKANREKMEDLLQEQVRKKYSSTINQNNSSASNSAKVIYAEKVETVEEKKTTASNKSTSKAAQSEEYTSQDILNKLDYYNSFTELTDEQIIEKITTLNKMLLSLVPKLDKKELQDDVNDIYKIIEKILKTLKKKKSKIKNINNFTTYYLPVTLKILIKYDEVENLKLNTENSNEFMNTVEDKIKMIKGSFQKQLESLYIEDFDDVEAELNVLETMLKTDGYSDIDDFNLRGKSN